VALEYHIPPLTRDDTRDYIVTRLRVAGALDFGPFTEPAVDRIIEYAHGIPRVVNMLCDHCLVIGYADQTRRIDRNIVNEAIENLNGFSQNGRPAHRARTDMRRRSAASPVVWFTRCAAVAVAAAGVGVFTFDAETLQSLRSVISTYLLDAWQALRHLLVS
jgi:hypothetical protein